MQKLSTLMVTLAIVSLTSCGGGSDGSELSLDDLASRSAAAFCQKLYQCCNADEIAQMESKYEFSGESGCADYFAGGMEQFFATPMRNAVAAGRGSYDAAKAQACLDAYQALGCTGSNDMNDFFDNCDSPYSGLQAAEAECVNSFECQAGLYCSTNTKTCQAFVAENGTCGTSGEPYCGAGLYCDAAGNTCVPQKAENAACTSTIECQAGLVCDENSSTCTEPELVCTGQ